MELVCLVVIPFVRVIRPRYARSSSEHYVKPGFSLLRKGQCGTGWLGVSSKQTNSDMCFARCRENKLCGYFAFAAAGKGDHNGNNCALYTKAGGCSTSTFKSYQIVSENHNRGVNGCECTGIGTGASGVLQGLPPSYGTSCQSWWDGRCQAHECGKRRAIPPYLQFYLGRL